MLVSYATYFYCPCINVIIMSRVILDTNIWSSIGDEQVVGRFDELMKSRNLRVVVAPSTLMEVARLPVPEARQRIIRALGTGPRTRLCTEAEAESREIVLEAKRVRPNWMRRMPDTAKVWALNNYWTKKVWREALQNSQRIHDYETRYSASLLDYLLNRQRDHRARFIQTNFQIRPLTALMVTPDPDAPESYLAGWSGEPVEIWRIMLRDFYWFQLSVLAGRAVLTKEDTTAADWIGAYVDLAKLRENRDDFTQFWLQDVELLKIPRNWLRNTVGIAQSDFKVTPGNPADEQHSAYLLDADLFLSADSRYVSMLTLVRNDAPFTFAEPKLVSGDRNVPIIERLADII
jgi:hypothetical protein